ncbi:MAG: hypothetical protein Q9204_007156 [Flavoplaca sp. TL-2023a]
MDAYTLSWYFQTPWIKGPNTMAKMAKKTEPHCPDATTVDLEIGLLIKDILLTLFNTTLRPRLSRFVPIVDSWAERYLLPKIFMEEQQPVAKRQKLDNDDDDSSETVSHDNDLSSSRPKPQDPLVPLFVQTATMESH